MAQAPNGIMGGFIGRIGNMSGYMRSGKYIVRSLPAHYNINETPARLAQQQKMKVSTGFMNAFGSGFFTKTFRTYSSKGTGYNQATSALLNLAITGAYPDIAIAYPMVLISKGSLPPAESAGAIVNSEGNILFSWADNSGTGTAKATDKAILLAYFPALNQTIYSLQSATRADGHAVLITNLMQGYTAETWMGFLSNDDKDAADSVYTGKIAL
jgi:hypothetical protein